jgi:hypothetical protein
MPIQGVGRAIQDRPELEDEAIPRRRITGGAALGELEILCVRSVH